MLKQLTKSSIVNSLDNQLPPPPPLTSTKIVIHVAKFMSDLKVTYVQNV